MTISGGGGGGDDGGGGRDGGGTEGGDCGGTVGGAEGTDTATATASKVIIITSTAAGSVESGSHAARTTCVRFFSLCEQGETPSHQTKHNNVRFFARHPSPNQRMPCTGVRDLTPVRFRQVEEGRRHGAVDHERSSADGGPPTRPRGGGPRTERAAYTKEQIYPCCQPTRRPVGDDTHSKVASR